MKRKFSLMWRVIITLVMVAGLMTVFTPAPMIANAQGGVSVNIIECPSGSPIPVCTNFGVKAQIINETGDIARNVTATVSVSDPTLAHVLPEYPESYAVGNNGTMDAGETDIVGWTLHCDAPGDVTVTVSTNYGGSASCLVMQEKPAALTVTVDAPCEIGTDCTGNTFEVTATIKNTGDVGAHGVMAVIAKSVPPGSATITPPLNVTVGTLAAGDDEDVIWDVTCTSAGDVTFTVTATGYEDYTENPLTANGSDTTHQRDAIVLVSRVWDGECPDPEDQTWDVISTEDTFAITARVQNYSNTLMNMNLTLTLPTGTVLDTTTPVHIHPEYPPDSDIPAVLTVPLNNVCGCCYVEVTWYLICTGSSNGQQVPIVVTATKATGEFLDVNTDCQDDAYIIQQNKVHLHTTLYAQVADCGGQTVDLTSSPFAVAVGQAFQIMASVTNTGEATAKGVHVNLNIIGTPSGSASCEGTHDVTIGDIPGGQTRTNTIGCECQQEGQISVQLATGGTPITGTDANTCEDILTKNIDSVCPGIIYQIPFTVQIVQPTGTETQIPACTTFTVKAKLTNASLTKDLTNVVATLNWTGNVQLAEGQGNPVNISLIAHAKDAQTPTVHEVTWQLVCKGQGETTFHVCVTSTTPPMLVGDINSPAVAITQTPPGEAEISMKLISPDTGAKYATSEDFAVTAVITNNEEDATVTINNVGLYWYPYDAVSIMESPETPFDIMAGGSQTVTWTMHCEGSGMVMLGGYASGVSEICETAETGTPPLILWQYPAAHLEVETYGYGYGDPTPTEVATGDTFPVTARITNTGEADATEVYATLSVTPEGSVGLAAGEKGYTKLVGTIPGHDSTANYKDVTWNLTCKQACTSTINVTASGNDEYGWHIKQESASTGNFIIEGGALTSEQLDNPPYYEYGYALPPVNRGWAYGVFVGDANGLAPGPFSVDTDLSMAKMGGGPDYLGHVVGMGFVIPHVEDGFLEYIIEDVCGMDPETLDLEGKDAMFWVVHITMDSPYDLIGPWSEWCVGPGLMEVINGTITATWSKYNEGLGQYQDSLLGGTFNSNLAAEAGRAIDTKFIEPASFTVKQVAEANLGITKVADGSTYTVGQTVTFTVDVINYGPGNATSIKVTDLLPSGVNYQSYSAGQGWYDVTSGVWDVGDLAYGNYTYLYIYAKVNTAGSITNRATITAADQHDPNTTNNSAVKTITGQAAPPTTTVSLVQGWNLISLPLIPEDPDIEGLLTSLNVNSVYGYSPFQAWKWYVPGVGDSTLTEMNDGWGYWMLMNATGTLSYDGYELAAPPPAVPPSYALVEGWNLVGFKSTTPKPITEYLAAISGKYTILYGYANGSYFIVGTAGHEYLQPGQGYWIAVIQPGTIYP